jgi:hypothetical protein
VNITHIRSVFIVVGSAWWIVAAAPLDAQIQEDSTASISTAFSPQPLLNKKTKRPKPPTISLSVAPTTINEGQAAVFTITATTVNPLQPIAVNYSMSGTATLGTDYTLSGGQFIIASGASTATVTLNALTDHVSPEPSETAIMNLVAASNGYKLAKTKKKKGAPPPTVNIVDVTPTPTPIPTSGFFLPMRGLYTQVIERRNYPNGYYDGQLIQTFNDFDSAEGSTPAQEASLQFDKMTAMGVNTITYELRTSDPTFDPTGFHPPSCNEPPSIGFQWPQPTATELNNLVAFFDLAQGKGVKIVLSLVNSHIEEQPPTNSETWISSILGAVKNHPALYLVNFAGDEHVRSDGTCGIPAEAPLWLGQNSYAGSYVKWAINFAMGLGVPSAKLSSEAAIGDYFVNSEPPAGPEATDGHLWNPILVLKQIFDALNIPNDQRTYALSFYEHRKCSTAQSLPCTDADPHTWADNTLQNVFEIIGAGNGSRVVAIEMGLSDKSTAGWTSERALESLYSLMGKYAVDGGSFWKWVAQSIQEDADTTNPDPIKRRGVDFVYNAVQKEVLDIGGFHIAVPNKSFEAGTSVADNWTIAGTGTGSRYFLAGEAGEPEVPSRGQYDLRLITGAGANDTISATSDLIPLIPNPNYTTTANLRFNWSGDPIPSGDPALRPQVFVSFHYYDGQGNPSAVRAADFFRFFQEDSTTGFATFPMQYMPPNDAASVRIEVGAARNGLPTAITLDADNLR